MLDFAGQKLPSGTITFKANDPSPEIITVKVKGDLLRESAGLPESFSVALGSATNGAVVDPLRASATGYIKDDDVLTGTEVFEATGGEMAFLATLAKAAYFLREGEAVGTGLNIFDPHAASAYFDARASLRLLDSSDFPSAAGIAPHLGADSVSVEGLRDGIYTHDNAAALVARSSDALFISFRGTNDDNVPTAAAAAALGALIGGAESAISAFDAASSRDMDHWIDFNPYWRVADEGMSDHYALFAPLLAAINSYVDDPQNHIKKVYVTGHSLGAAMAQKFMLTHGGNRYESIVFGSPGLEGLSSVNDHRITNIRMNADPISVLGDVFLYGERGDSFVLNDQQGAIGGSNHSMDLYLSAAKFLSSASFQDRFADGLIGQFENGKLEEISVALDVIGDGPWDVAFAKGSVLGTGGPDVLLGGDSPDILNGLGGNDVLSGGLNSDIFVFEKTRFRTAGRDTVLDFHPGEDFVQVSGLFTSFGSLVANASEANGSTTIIYNASNSLTLLGTPLSALHNQDFIFV